MNAGVIQGNLLTHCSTRDQAVNCLKSIDATNEQKNRFYKYWKETREMQEHALKLKKIKLQAKLNKGARR